MNPEFNETRVDWSTARPISVYEIYGEVLYEGYCQQSDGKSLKTGELLPLWPDQDQRIRDAWAAAAKALITKFTTDAASWQKALHDDSLR